MTRFYASHRRAYYPRFWPLALASGVLVVMVTLFVRLTVLEAIPLGIVIGVVVGGGRLEVWKHRHPVITPAEYITDLQRAAKWN